jgi:hypothetical protein
VFKSLENNKLDASMSLTAMPMCSILFIKKIKNKSM